MGGGSVSDPETSSESSPTSDHTSQDPLTSDTDIDTHDDDARRRRRRTKTFLEVLAKYEEAASVSAAALKEAKNSITSHRAGDWIEEVGGTSRETDYEIPQLITFLVVGPKGSGKSNLINKITRVFEDVCDSQFLADRAQVSNKLEVGSLGSCFLQEYVVPRLKGDGLFCMYDTRGLSTVTDENYTLFKKWMTEGVTHGEMIVRASDDEATKKRIKAMSRQRLFTPCQKRTVNFVLFVIDGVSVLKSMNSGDSQYTDMLVETFNYPFMSFKDDKPVVVITHGDELSLTDRARVCTHLGDLFDVPPTQQIFDIPESTDFVTELAIVRMLWYSIEHANRNLPYKHHYLLEAPDMTLRMVDKLQGFELWRQIMNTLQGFEFWRPVMEVVIICLCIIAVIFRLNESL